MFQVFTLKTKHNDLTCFILETAMLRSTLLVLVISGFVLAVSGFPYLNRKKFYRGYRIDYEIRIVFFKENIIFKYLEKRSMCLIKTHKEKSYIKFAGGIAS